MSASRLPGYPEAVSLPMSRTTPEMLASGCTALGERLTTPAR